MNTYRVTVQQPTSAGTVKVQAADKDAAKVEAVKSMVRHAKEYNAKYHESFAAHGVEWAMHSEDPAHYVATKVCKAAVRAAA